ncbi:MAG: PDZ domain-containing protein [Ignavibacteriales bacterium]
MRAFDRLRRFLRRYGAHVVGAVLVVSVLLYVPTGYYVISPGDVRALSASVAVENASGVKDGEFYLVTVATRRANALLHIYGLVDPSSVLRPEREMIPPGQDEEEYFEESRRMMMESQETAKVVALRRMGYDARLSGSGVRVVGLLPSGAASGILAPGDIIVAVDGKAVLLADELIHEMARYSPGDTVSVEVLRGGERLTLRTPTGRHPEDPERAALGIQIETFNWHAVVPVGVSIDTGSISGPSGGLMLSLEIIRQLNGDASLLRGSRVAGTGTIAPGGGVGPVGGVTQKVIAAERAGVKAFLAPRENAAEAMEAARRMTIVPVGTLDDALDYLVSEGGSLKPAIP